MAAEQADNVRLAQLQGQIDDADGWRVAAEVTATIQRLQLDPDAAFADLSGGQKRRTLLGRALVGSSMTNTFAGSANSRASASLARSPPDNALKGPFARSGLNRKSPR